MILSRKLFWAICLPAVLIALVSLRPLVLPMSLVMPQMAAYVGDMPVAVWGHILFAPLALALAPLQLVAGLRLRRPWLHRWAGRIYGVSVLLAGAASLALLPVSLMSGFARAGFAVLALLWIGTTALGIMAARRGAFGLHRRWMLRSVALTWAAVSLRVIMAPLVAMGWSVAETYDITAWGSWLLTLAVAEWWLRRGEAGRTGKAVAEVAPRNGGQAMGLRG